MTVTLPISSQGSSPPVRGAPAGGLDEVAANGLIPARAGSTRHHGQPYENQRAHPRPCGEHELA